MKRDLHVEITTRILDQMRAGSAPWVKSWNDTKIGGSRIPHNAATGRPYSGGNVFVLWMEAALNPTWTTLAFMTYNQAAAIGAQVRKGETGTKIAFYGQTKKTDEKTGDEKMIPFVKAMSVFNVAQIDKLDPAKLKTADVLPLVPDEGTLAEFYAYVDANTVHGGNTAAFIPSEDIIQMPHLQQFHSEANYHSVRLHETVHWTGHKTRLDRGFEKRFDRHARAAEELTAELGSALLCAELGVEGDLRHADYLSHWIKLLEDHDRAFFAAASAAQKAVDFIRRRVNAAEPLTLAMAA